MPTRFYRLTVIGSALAWFLVGLHWPIVHEMTRHGRTPDTMVLVVVAMLVVLGLATLWVLLRPANRNAV